MEAPLNELVFPDCHVVPQIVKSQFAVGHIGNVTAVGGPAPGAVHARQNGAHRQAQKLMDPTHLVRVPLGQIIVDSDHMNAQARQGVEVSGQCGHQCLAFAGSHFGNAPLVQHHAAHQLGGKMLHAQHPAAGLPHNRVGLRQQVIQRFSFRQTAPEFLGFVPQRLIAQGDCGVPVPQDPVHDLLYFFQFPFAAGHAISSSFIVQIPSDF